MAVAGFGSREMSEWWAGVLRLDKHVYEAGRVLDLSVPASLADLRGPDASIGRLYVRKGFSDLFAQIVNAARPGGWLGHINGNSGVGKSAFLWYFIVRYGIYMTEHGVGFLLVYQSAGFIWELSSNGQVSICKKGAYPHSHFRRAAWHLINQKVESQDTLGSLVLVAASPDSSNLKSTKPDVVRDVFFVYPWDETEFQALLALWKDESQEMVKRAEELESQLQGPEDTSAVEEDSSLIETLSMLSSLSSASPVGWKETALSLRSGSQTLDSQIEAANLFYSWYGGIPRLLRKAPLSSLNEEEYRRKVCSSLAKTDLAQVISAVLSNAGSDNISWLLLHFKEPSAGFSRYTLDFASAKIKYMFTETLTRAKQEDLNLLLKSSDPELGALRGYIFEQDVVRRLLNSSLGTTVLVDKHCHSCNRRTLEGHRGDTVWIACCVCNNWCHQRCVLPGSDDMYEPWTCAACVEQANQHTIPTRGLRLKYYNGDLETALLAAGAEAASFVWRPLKKNNAAFDFVVLPNILGQATVAEKHPVPVEAVRKGLAALLAWSTKYRACAPEYLLAFFVMRQNSTNFRYQSYRDKSRRVCDKGVQGITQVKVVVDTSQWIELQLPAEVVDKLENLDFRQQNLAALTVSELKALAKVWGMSGYSGMRKQELIQEMEAWSARDEEEEDREIERSAYQSLYPGRCY